MRCYHALKHLSEIAPFIRVIGSYPREAVYLGRESEAHSVWREVLYPLPASSSHPRSQRLRVGIVGYGRFGRFLSKHLREGQSDVWAINLREEEDFTQEAVADGLVPEKNYYQGYNNIQKFLSNTLDVIVFTVSVLSFEEVLTSFVPYLTTELIVDVLSVKVHPYQIMKKLVHESCDVLCSHPMFGPDSGKDSWVGLPFMYHKIRVKDFHRCARFLSFFEGKGCRMISMSCSEHDRIASASQFITHLTARVLSALDLKPSDIDTKGFKTLLALVESANKDSFDLFFALFKHNEFSSQQLRLMESALNKVKDQLYEKEAQQLLAKERGQEGEKEIVFNSRVESLAPSRTAYITDIARKMKEQGIDVIALSVGQPDFEPPLNVTEAAIKACRDHTKYTEVNGLSVLRQEISKYLKTKNTEYSPEEILCSSGAKQSIFQAVLALCRPGDEVLIPAPYWVSYPEITKLSGATPKFVETLEEDNFCLTPEQLEREITLNTRLLILCNPSNPTGHVYSRDQLEKLASVLERHPQVFVLSDEIYEKVLFEGEHISFASLPGMHDRTLTVNGFSKGFSMTGYRLGYLAGPKRIISACAKIQSHNTTCPSSITQYAAISALRDTDESYFTESNAGFKKKRDIVLAYLKKAGVECPVPTGAFYVFFSVKQFLTEATGLTTSEELCVYLLEKCHVGLVPGEAFGLAGFVRVSYATSVPVLEEAMERITKGLLELKH
eukprot:TRINITY_DN1471_c0_g1_i2.p1 TRINITY_DN1471_c0_g1~~TRINITY_DN1471_c0_g1_i2.p1  ORF type:complete len:725 (-),score=190.91 TRINITY_DN1471_c0_g1_i2:62-2236(-)